MAQEQFKLNYIRQAILIASVLGLPAVAQTSVIPKEIQEQIQRQQNQQSKDKNKTVQEQQPVTPDVHLDSTATSPAVEAPITQLPITESPNFQIKQIQLTGDSAKQFEFALYAALKQTKLHPIGDQSNHTTYIVTDEQLKSSSSDMRIGAPLGAKGINALMTAAQNAVIERGYTTTRILAEPQDLKSGILKLTVIPGRVRHINVDTSNIAQTHADRAILYNALPMKEGDILNLRDIEQGLENLKRVPTVEADIKIAPADSPNESDLNISWQQQRIPLRMNMSYDDSGGRSTGKYQGSTTLSIDSPFRINDLFYMSYGQDISGYDKVNTTDDKGQVNGNRHGQSDNWSLHYSVPMGYWEAAFNASSYYYNQAVAGINQTYAYSGHSRTQDIKLSRLLHRDADSKTAGYVKGWSRYSDNYIDDAEISDQRRRTAGFELGLTHKQSIGNIQLDSTLAYKRGTGAFNAMRAPEETFGEGTSRMKLITADLNLNVPWNIKNTALNFNSAVHAQWNKTRLTAQDKIAIGGRSTVRGFDGDMSLSAERGFYVRNDLSISYLPNQSIYLALDAGHVSGPSTQWLLGQTLVGAAIGLKGQFKAGGNLQYDVFVGTPVKKPNGFNTRHTTYGFNLNYSF